jgi:DNA repair protein RadA/Sms
MGFTRCLVPQSNIKRAGKVNGIEVVGIKNVAEAMEYLF